MSPQEIEKYYEEFHFDRNRSLIANSKAARSYWQLKYNEAIDDTERSEATKKLERLAQLEFEFENLLRVDWLEQMLRWQKKVVIYVSMSVTLLGTAYAWYCYKNIPVFSKFISGTFVLALILCFFYIFNKLKHQETIWHSVLKSLKEYFEKTDPQDRVEHNAAIPAICPNAKQEKNKRMIKQRIKIPLVTVVGISTMAIMCFLAIVIHFFPDMLSLPTILSSPKSVRWFVSNRNANSYTIKSAEGLAGLAEIVNGTWGGVPEKYNFLGRTIKLGKNIDLSRYENWVPIGSAVSVKDSAGVEIWIPREFSGTFDGGGYVIRNLTINRPAEDDQGLFGMVINGKLENIGLDSAKIYGRNNVGIVAGHIKSNSVITNSYSRGIIHSSGSAIGGIVGKVADSSKITGSYSYAEVNGGINVGGVIGTVINNSHILDSYSKGEIQGDGNYVGGVAGQIQNGSSINKSYFTGIVRGNQNRIGGIAGSVLMRSTVTNSYSMGSVSGDRVVGGLVGCLEIYSSIADSYSNGSVRGNISVGGIVGRVLRDSDVTRTYSICSIISKDTACIINVGGIAGFIDSSGRVNSSAALNSTLRGCTDFLFGRVAGARPGNIFSNNVAYDEMNDYILGTVRSNKNLNGKNGEDITAAFIQSDPTIGGRFMTTNGWTIEPGKLPGLFGSTVAMPEHLTE